MFSRFLLVAWSTAVISFRGHETFFILKKKNLNITMLYLELQIYWRQMWPVTIAGSPDGLSRTREAPRCELNSSWSRWIWSRTKLFPESAWTLLKSSAWTQSVSFASRYKSYRHNLHKDSRRHWTNQAFWSLESDKQQLSYGKIRALWAFSWWFLK